MRNFENILTEEEIKLLHGISPMILQMIEQQTEIAKFKYSEKDGIINMVNEIKLMSSRMSEEQRIKAEEAMIQKIKESTRLSGRLKGVKNADDLEEKTLEYFEELRELQIEGEKSISILKNLRRKLNPIIDIL